MRLVIVDLVLIRRDPYLVHPRREAMNHLLDYFLAIASFPSERDLVVLCEHGKKGLNLAPLSFEIQFRNITASRLRLFGGFDDPRALLCGKRVQ